MAKKNDLTKYLLPVAIAGAAYFIYQGMQDGSTKNGNGNGSGSSTSSGSGQKWWQKAGSLFKPPSSAVLQEACDLSYSKIGANRYLCYKGLKKPREEHLHLLEPKTDNGNGNGGNGNGE